MSSNFTNVHKCSMSLLSPRLFWDSLSPARSLKLRQAELRVHEAKPVEGESKAPFFERFHDVYIIYIYILY